MLWSDKPIGLSVHYMLTMVGYYWFAILETPNEHAHHGSLVTRLPMAPGGIGTDPQASVPMLITEYFRIFPPVTFSYLGGVQIDQPIYRICDRPH